MKIRTGFVSNSSSSSFCIVGYAFDSDVGIGKFLDNYEIRGIADEKELYLGGPPEGYTYLGLSFGKMKDDETKAEFFKRAEKEIKEFLVEINAPGISEEEKIDIYTEGWYDG